MDSNLNNFMIDYIVDSGANLLVLSQRGLDRSKLIGYQVEMVSCNQISGILDFALREKNAEVSLQYNLKGYASLANFLKRRQIKQHEFITLLEKMITVLLESKRYLLNESSFVFDENLIYINPETLQVFLVYLPLSFKKDVILSFKEFLINLIIYGANIESNGHFIEQILALLKQDDFTFLQFSKQLRKIKSANYQEQPPLELPLAESIDYGAEIACAEPEKLSLKQRAAEQIPLSQQGSRVKGLVIVLGASAALLALASLVITPTNLVEYWSLVKDYSYILVLGTAAAIILVFYLLNYGRNKSLLAEKRLKDQEKLHKLKAEMEHQGAVRYNVPQVINKEQAVLSVEEFSVANQVQAELSIQNVDETVVLMQHYGSMLKSVMGEETILLTKNDLIIGRNAQTCDFVIANQSVGRAHAQIKLVDDVYYLIDLDSRNGTFINGTKLVSNKQYPLKHSDKVTFANAEYCFESMPSSL